MVLYTRSYQVYTRYQVYSSRNVKKAKLASSERGTDGGAEICPQSEAGSQSSVDGGGWSGVRKIEQEARKFGDHESMQKISEYLTCHRYTGLAFFNSIILVRT